MKKDFKEAPEIFLKKKKKKNDNMVVNARKICQKMKSKSLLRIEKNIIEREKKRLIIKDNDLEISF